MNLEKPERALRIAQGASEIALLLGYTRFEGLARISGSLRCAIFAMEFLDDLRKLSEGDMFQGDWKEKVSDLTGLVVDLSSFTALLTDVMQEVPKSKAHFWIDLLCRPSLVILLSIACWKEPSAKNGLDLLHVDLSLTPLADLLQPWGHLITGSVGLYTLLTKSSQ